MAKYLDATGVSTLWGKIKSSFASSGHNHDSRYMRLYDLVEKDFNIPDGGSISGIYYVHGAVVQTNAPATYGLIADFNTGAGHLQLWGSSGNDLKARSYWWTMGSDFSGYTDWVSLIHSGNIGSQSVSYASSAGSVAWGNITGKPSTFTPSAHSHSEYLPRNTNSNVLPQFSGAPEYLLGIEAFANNGTVKWQSASSVNVGYATNCDTVDGYHASSLWRSDGGTWSPGANITLGATANNQEWSFDISRNGHTGTMWHVWDVTRGGYMLAVTADDGKVRAPYGFVGNLEGSASYASSAGNADLLDGQRGSYYHIHTSRSYTSVDAMPSGSEGWYSIFNISDYTDGSVICTIKAYAHSSLTFIASKGWSTGATLQILQYNSSNNDSYFYVKGVRIVEGGKVQALFNKTSGTSTYIHVNINIFSSNGTLRPNETLTLETGNPTVIAGPLQGTHGKITSDIVGNITGSAGSVAWANVSDKPSTFTPSSHTHSYLPLSGGTLSNASFGGQLMIERSGSANMAAIGFKNSSGILGYLATNTVNGAFVRYNAAASTYYNILDSSNSSVSKSGETLTVKINGTSQSLTNTWRGITDSYSGTDTSISLSQKGANNLYNALVNGYANSAGNSDKLQGYYAAFNKLFATSKSVTMTTVQTYWYVKIELSAYAQPRQIYIDCSYNNEVDRSLIEFSGMSYGYIYRNCCQNGGNIKGICMHTVYDSSEHIWIFWIKFDKIMDTGHYSPSSQATCTVYLDNSNSAFNVLATTTEPTGVDWISTGDSSNNIIIKNCALYGSVIGNASTATSASSVPSLSNSEIDSIIV